MAGRAVSPINLHVPSPERHTGMTACDEGSFGKASGPTWQVASTSEAANVSVALRQLGLSRLDASLTGPGYSGQEQLGRPLFTERALDAPGRGQSHEITRALLEDPLIWLQELVVQWSA
jgi:hypothetical protein